MELEQIRFGVNTPLVCSIILCNKVKAYYIEMKCSCTEFSVLNHLNIVFINEDGYDSGGLMREFLRLLLNELRTNTRLLEGDEYEKHLVYNSESLKKKR